MKGLGGNMGYRSFRVRSVLLGFLLSGGTIGLVSAWYVSIEYVLVVTLVGAVLWGAASLVAFSLYESRRKFLQQRARLRRVPAKEARSVDHAPEPLVTPSWAITPLSVATMSIPRALLRAIAGDQGENVLPQDDFGEREITGEELDANIEEVRRRQLNGEKVRKNRYVRWCMKMGLTHTDARYVHWCRTVDMKPLDNNDAP